MSLSVSRPMFSRDDFKDFALFQLITEFWRLVEDYDEHEYSICYFSIPNYKKWIFEFLKGKWPSNALSLDYGLARINELHPQCDPTLRSDSEKYFEKLLRYKKVIKRRKRIKFKRYLQYFVIFLS